MDLAERGAWPGQEKRFAARTIADAAAFSPRGAASCGEGRLP
jgi:hypothetical protein